MSDPKSAKILIVDDDESQLEMSARRLERAGYEVFKATFWGDAQQYLRAVDLVLLDIHLKTVDGDRLCSIIKTHSGAYGELKVLLHSSADEIKIRKKARESGADGYICKGKSRADFLHEIEQYLSGERVF